MGVRSYVMGVFDIFDRCHGDTRTGSRRYSVSVLDIFDRCLRDI